MCASFIDLTVSYVGCWSRLPSTYLHASQFAKYYGEYYLTISYCIFKEWITGNTRQSEWLKQGTLSLKCLLERKICLKSANIACSSKYFFPVIWAGFHYYSFLYVSHISILGTPACRSPCYGPVRRNAHFYCKRCICRDIARYGSWYGFVRADRFWQRYVC